MNMYLDRMLRAAKLEPGLHEEVEKERSGMGQTMGVVALSNIAAGIGRFSRMLLYGAGAVLVSLSVIPAACGNDSAAAIGEGGIELVRQENIAMEKEELFISADKVTVAYEFRNLSDRDITTEIAFPIQEFRSPCNSGHQNRRFDDFKVFVDGIPVAYETEIKARVKGKDVADVLRKHGIRPETFGDYVCDDLYGGSAYAVGKLSPDEKRKLTESGIIEDDVNYPAPLWTVVMKYHWTQTFPAQGVVSIRHEYHPLVGYAHVTADEFLKAHKDACVDESTVKALNMPEGSYIPTYWINYILTTANSWKTPIGDFTLRIAPMKYNSAETLRIVFCWNGPVEVNEKGETTVHMKNFIPQKELSVLYYGSPVKEW